MVTVLPPPGGETRHSPGAFQPSARAHRSRKHRGAVGEGDRRQRPVLRCPRVAARKGRERARRGGVQRPAAAEAVGGVEDAGRAEAGGVLPPGRGQRRRPGPAGAPAPAAPGRPARPRVGARRQRYSPTREELLLAGGDGLGDLLGAGQVELLGRVADGPALQAGLGHAGLHRPLRPQALDGRGGGDRVDVLDELHVPAQVEQQRAPASRRSPWAASPGRPGCASTPPAPSWP